MNNGYQFLSRDMMRTFLTSRFQQPCNFIKVRMVFLFALPPVKSRQSVIISCLSICARFQQLSYCFGLPKEGCDNIRGLSPCHYPLPLYLHPLSSNSLVASMVRPVNMKPPPELYSHHYFLPLCPPLLPVTLLLLLYARKPAARIRAVAPSLLIAFIYAPALYEQLPYFKFRCFQPLPPALEVFEHQLEPNYVDVLSSHPFVLEMSDHLHLLHSSLLATHRNLSSKAHQLE